MSNAEEFGRLANELLIQIYANYPTMSLDRSSFLIPDDPFILDTSGTYMSQLKRSETVTHPCPINTLQSK
jgi:hypothetical protein